MLSRSAFARTLLIGIAALSLSIGSVSAATGVSDIDMGRAGSAESTSAACAGAHAIFYEDNGYEGSGLLVCFGENIRNLGTVRANTGCDGGWIVYEDWHDCISSFKVLNADCHHKLDVYVDTDYGVRMPGPYSGKGSRSIRNMHGYNDTMSSLKWTYLSQCPTSPEG